MGRNGKTTSRIGNKNSGNRGIDPRWSSWVEAAAPITETLRGARLDLSTDTTERYLITAVFPVEQSTSIGRSSTRKILMQ